MKPMLAHNWNTTIDPCGWYMSEKLDGIRAIWDGNNFISRNEKVFNTPDWFKQDMPTSLLDGELWSGRGLFNYTSGQVRRKYDMDWSKIKYIVFDIPKPGERFEFRNKLLTHIKMPSHVQIIKQIKCKGIKHLQQFELDIISNGGEGVILHHPDNEYTYNKRSKYLLKVKQFKDDDAIVIDYENGKGKYGGMVGALICQYKDNIITIGTGMTDEDRNNPPKIGSTIIFKYFEMNNNIPRFPVYVGIRAD